METPDTILALKSIMLDTVILNDLSMCTDGYFKITKPARLDISPYKYHPRDFIDLFEPPLYLDGSQLNNLLVHNHLKIKWLAIFAHACHY